MSSSNQQPICAFLSSKGVLATRGVQLAVLLGVFGSLHIGCSSSSSSPTEPPIDTPDEVTVAATSGQIPVATVTVSGEVTAVDLDGPFVVLGVGRRVFIFEATRWDRAGNLHSITELKSAFERGRKISLKASGTVNGFGDLKARRIKATRS